LYQITGPPLQEQASVLVRILVSQRPLVRQRLQPMLDTLTHHLSRLADQPPGRFRLLDGRFNVSQAMPECGPTVIDGLPLLCGGVR